MPWVEVARMAQVREAEARFTGPHTQRSTLGCLHSQRCVNSVPSVGVLGEPEGHSCAMESHDRRVKSLSSGHQGAHRRLQPWLCKGHSVPVVCPLPSAGMGPQVFTGEVTFTRSRSWSAPHLQWGTQVSTRTPDWELHGGDPGHSAN